MPTTTRNAPCTAAVAAGPTSARSRATRSPLVNAARAAAATPALSRSWALLARMVRAAVMARSTAAVMSPIRACASFDAGRTRRAKTSEKLSAMPMPRTVTPNSSGSMTTMPTAAPTAMTAPVTVSNRPEVTTARSSVVSAPTRESRSPVRRWSYSVIGRRSRCAASRVRADSTMPSAVRASTYSWIPSSTATAQSTSTSSRTGPQTGTLPTPLSTWRVSSGCSRVPPARTSDSTATTTRASRCARR